MRALIVDDDAGIRWILTRVLKEEGFDVLEAENLADAKALQSQTIDLVFLDVFLPDGNGMQALSSGVFSAPVIMLTAETTFGHAAEAYREGAMEYLPKPFDLDEVRRLAQRVLGSVKKPKKQAKISKKQQAAEKEKKSMIIGRSPAMQVLFRTLGRVAPSDLTVLITGESGTGKELVAHELHRLSHRKDKSFIAINTAAIPAELLESELFGHEKGAFTGADKHRAGRFEDADGGTLFLDEIGDMPMVLQSKMLRVLEMGMVQRIGGNEEKKVNVRLLAATHQNLQQKIRDGQFREDLYYRLNVIPVHIPPLRERRDDIPELAATLLQQASDELSMTAPILLDHSVDLLKRHDWYGNVRELKNVMRRLAVLTPGASITVSDVALALGHDGGQQSLGGLESLDEAVTRCLRAYMDKLGYAEATGLHHHLLSMVEPALLNLVLDKCRGNQLKAANMLGLNRNTVRKLIRQYEIDPTEFKD
ncbi:MAG: sigma-54-dependent Fis family transcriptional regulator [Zetaproteobacteria bacterium]|nr:sigma-54-dependent Fis family transcriptional regulator [Zetaproteobacteria bacterium]